MYELIVFCVGGCNAYLTVTKYGVKWIWHSSNYPISFLKKPEDIRCFLENDFLTFGP